MAVDWEEYKKEAQKAADEARANVLAEIQKVEDFYKEQFAKAQSAAIEARNADVGLGETPQAYAARIAAVPGSFNDRAQSAAQVVNSPRREALIAASGVATSVTVPGSVAAPSSTVQAPVSAVAEESSPAVQEQPEPQEKEEVSAEPVAESQPDQPTPESVQSPSPAVQESPSETPAA